VTRERSESELSKLKRRAQELAATRRERATTVHLLAAVAGLPGPASLLLTGRGLDQDAVLKAGRTFDEEGPDPIGRVLAQAREVVRRARGPVSTDRVVRGEPSLSPDSRLVHLEPGSLHALVALLSDRRSAAHRALVQSGVDVSRLLAAALTQALGIVSAAKPPRTEPTHRPVRGRAGAPTVVPLVPPSRDRTPQSSPPGRPSEPSTQTPTPTPSAPSSERRSTPPPAPATRSTPPGGRPVRAGNAPPARPGQVRKAGPVARALTPSARTPSSAPRLDALDPGRYPTLAAFASRVLPPAEDRIAMRGAEVQRVLDVLGKHRANTPCLVGPPGVGKTSVALALASELELEGRMLVELRVPSLVAGAATRGSLGERIAAGFDELRHDRGRSLLFVDDFHELLSLGDEATSELKAQLARADVPVVFASSAEALRKLVDAEPQLARRLQIVEVDEPDEEAAFCMVRRAAEELGAYHDVDYRDEVIAASVSWSLRYMPGRALPDKAISLLDLAGARARRQKRREVELSELAEVVAGETDVPVERLLETDRERMLHLEEQLAERVVGHVSAIGRIARQLRKAAAGLRGKRPLGSFMLLGPTGVGKTETAKALAEALFGSADAMTRIDMSEYGEAHAVARLLGAPPGYVGHEAGGQLTEAVRRRPYQVVLLDEIEKAHPEVLLAFLQVLDEGHLTDGRGRRIDFSNTVVVLTSNLGAREMLEVQRGRSVGFGRASVQIAGEALERACIDAARKTLAPELYNRIDEVVFYAPLERAEVAEVARGMLRGLGKTLATRDIELDVDDAAIDVLLDRGGYEPELGARPMRRTIARLVEVPLAELLLRGELDDGGVVLVGVEGSEIVVDAAPRAARAAG
jgi:ATP-dependent Clp protease ATP-binding subunit ClpC